MEANRQFMKSKYHKTVRQTKKNTQREIFVQKKRRLSASRPLCITWSSIIAVIWSTHKCYLIDRQWASAARPKIWTLNKDTLTQRKGYESHSRDRPSHGEGYSMQIYLLTCLLPLWWQVTLAHWTHLSSRGGGLTTRVASIKGRGVLHKDGHGHDFITTRCHCAALKNNHQHCAFLHSQISRRRYDLRLTSAMHILTFCTAFVHTLPWKYFPQTMQA